MFLETEIGRGLSSEFGNILANVANDDRTARQYVKFTRFRPGKHQTWTVFAQYRSRNWTVPAEFTAAVDVSFR